MSKCLLRVTATYRRSRVLHDMVFFGMVIPWSNIICPAGTYNWWRRVTGENASKQVLDTAVPVDFLSLCLNH